MVLYFFYIFNNDDVLLVFVGDIGGSMGLFIGASVLSLFEIFDFLMSQSLMRTRRKLLSEVKDKHSYK